MTEIKGKGDANEYVRIESSIDVLDPWNSERYKVAVAVLADKSFLLPLTDMPGMDEKRRQYVERYKQRAPLDAWQLREKHPHCIPVDFDEHPAGSGTRAIGPTKYLVHDADMPIGEFVVAIRRWFAHTGYGPVFVYVNNIDVSEDALMSEIDEQHGFEDGFLHLTYTGVYPCAGRVHYRTKSEFDEANRAEFEFDEANRDGDNERGSGNKPSKNMNASKKKKAKGNKFKLLGIHFQFKKKKNKHMNAPKKKAKLLGIHFQFKKKKTKRSSTTAISIIIN